MVYPALSTTTILNHMCINTILCTICDIMKVENWSNKIMNTFFVHDII